MLFRNLCIFRVNPTALPQLEPDQLEKSLEDFAFEPVGPQQIESRGWVPTRLDPRSLVGSHGRHDVLLCQRRQERLLPGGAVNEAMAERLEEYYHRTGQWPLRRERQRLREELVLSMLPKAFTQSKLTHAWIDAEHGLLVVDTATWSRAEDLTDDLRAALGSLPVSPLQTRESPIAKLTAWVRNPEERPARIELGKEAVLEEPQSSGGEIRLKRVELDDEEIRSCLAAGWNVRRLSLTYQGRLSCVLDADLSVKRLKFLDEALTELDDQTLESPGDWERANFKLQCQELSELIASMVTWFGGLPRSSTEAFEDGEDCSLGL